MKKLLFPLMCLGLTGLLTACPNNDTRNLTVNLTGVSSAPVKVTNTSTGAVLWNDTLSSGKTFSGITTGNVLSVQGGAVNNYLTPAAQTVTLDADKAVTLAYAQQAGSPLNSVRMTGKVTGTNLALGNAYIGSANDNFFGKTILTNNALDADLNLLTPTATDLSSGFFTDGCTGTNSDPAAQTLYNSTLNVYSTQGDLLGLLFEDVIGGSDAKLTSPIIVRLYSDRAFTFTGTCSLTSSSGNTITESVNITIQKGWNALVESGSGSSLLLQNASPDDRIQITFVSAQPSVVVALNPSTLSFTSDAAVTVDAKLIQVGGYSGTVNLTTDVAGLAMQPSSVNLPALPILQAQSLHLQSEKLGRLSLTPQMLTTKLTFTYTGPNIISTDFNIVVKNDAGQQVGAGTGKYDAYRPSFEIKLSSPLNGAVYAGETNDIRVTVQSVLNFSENVTLSLDKNNFGFTGVPQNITLSPLDQPFTITTPPSIIPGAYNVNLTGKSMTGSRVVTQPIQIIVYPRRYQITGSGALNTIAPSATGIWIIGGSDTSTTPNGTFITEIKSDGSQKIITIPDSINYLKSYINGTFLALPYSAPQGYIVAQNGSYTKATFNSGATSGAFDSSGKLWFTQTRIIGIGGMTTDLAVYDPANNTTSIADSTLDYTGATLTGSNNGTFIYGISQNTNLFQINTSTNAITKLGIINTSGLFNIAASNNGTICYTESLAIKCFNSVSGVTKNINGNDSIDKILGFDYKSENLLWATAIGGKVIAVDTSTGTSKAILVGDAYGGIPRLSGGLSVLLHSLKEGNLLSFVAFIDNQ